MKKTKDIGKENMRLTLVLWVLLCGISMALMLMCSAKKTIVIADAAQDETQTTVDEKFEKPIIQTREVVLQSATDSEDRFYISLPDDVKAEDVIMENRYWDSELRIRVKSGSADFYENCTIQGDISTIDSAVCEMKADGILLRVKTGSLLEYRSTMEGKTLVLAFYRPEELYDTIILLDPAWGGEETGLVGEAIPAEVGQADGNLYEKDVTLQVARLVQKNLALESVKVYLTRAEDVTTTEEERLAFIKETGADLYIRLHAKSRDDAAHYGISCGYNGQYFIPDFGNVQLADMLTREVTIATSNRAEGLSAVDESNILKQIEVPAAELCLGYFSNETERELLGQAVYQEKLAAGIINAIIKIQETMTKAGTEK